MVKILKTTECRIMSNVRKERTKIWEHCFDSTDRIPYKSTIIKFIFIEIKCSRNEGFLF